MPNSKKTHIYNLKDFITSLKDKPTKALVKGIIDRIKFGYKEIEHLCFWDADNFSKISIARNDGYELALICWEKGQQSQIYNHNNPENWIYVLKGEITEDIFEEKDDEKPKSSIVLNRSKHNLNPLGLTHRLLNSFNGRSVSLHLYLI